MSTSGRIRVGISGWTYAGWRGDFYPTGLVHRLELAYAAERLELDRGERLVLLAAAARVVPLLARADARRLRLLGQGRALHHAPEATRGRRDAAGQLLRLRGAGAGPEAGPDPVAAPGEPGLRRRAAGGVLRAAAAHHGRGGRARPAPRRQGGRGPRADHGRGRPPAAARPRVPQRDVLHAEAFAVLREHDVACVSPTPRGASRAPSRTPATSATSACTATRSSTPPATRPRRSTAGRRSAGPGRPRATSSSTSTTMPRATRRTTRWPWSSDCADSR